MQVKINGLDGVDLGAIRTGKNFLLDAFREPHLTFSIKGGGKRVSQRTVEVKRIITGAVEYIDRNCAGNGKCNDYFRTLASRNPISLREILDNKTLYIFRLKPIGGAGVGDLPAGFTEGWGEIYARIGLNDLMLTDVMSAASVILHELAHVAGAPGRDVNAESIAAENALVHCGMKKYFDANAKG
jgi:hypothetical protein